MASENTQLLEDNIRLVWNERDPAARLQAIKRLYSIDAKLCHVGSVETGHENINASVSAVLKGLPAGFEFTLQKPVIINNGIGRAIWGAVPGGQAPVATGMDIVQLQDGKIQALYVFLDA